MDAFTDKLPKSCVLCRLCFVSTSLLMILYLYFQLGVVLIIIFLFSWSPFAIISLWAALGDPSNIPGWLAIIAPFAAKWTPSLNPLMFVIFIKKFRKYTLMILCCRTHVETIELTQPTPSVDVQSEEQVLWLWRYNTLYCRPMKAGGVRGWYETLPEWEHR